MNWRASAFSIVELLVVVGLLVILLGLAAPAVSSLMRATGVTNAGDQILGALSQARMASLSRNRAVEVRLYRYPSPDDPDKVPRYQALQSFVIEPFEGGFRTNALGRFVKLPQGTVLAESPELSSALSAPASQPVPGSQLGVRIPPAGLDYSASILRFRADGSLATGATNDVHLTVLPSTLPPDAAEPGPNFATISLQPPTGKARLLRP